MKGESGRPGEETAARTDPATYPSVTRVRTTRKFNVFCGCPTADHIAGCNVGRPVEVTACFDCVAVGIERLKEIAKRDDPSCRCAKALGVILPAVRRD